MHSCALKKKKKRAVSDISGIPAPRENTDVSRANMGVQ